MVYRKLLEFTTHLVNNYRRYRPFKKIKNNKEGSLLLIVCKIFITDSLLTLTIIIFIPSVRISFKVKLLWTVALKFQKFE